MAGDPDGGDAGARFGPGHVRAASKLLRPYNPALDATPFGTQQVADAGDIGVNPFDLREAIETIDREVTALRADGAQLLTIGGDHTIALPILRSLARDHGPVAVLHFDAHLDTWDTYFGAPHTHGTPFRRASEEGLIDMERSLHMGIRGPLYSKQDLEDDAVLGFQVIRSDDYEVDGVRSIVERMRSRLGGGPIYVSVDIDVLDPAHAPGTGTPKAGGLTSRELPNTLRGLAGLDVVGADIVEVSPPYDHAELTGIAAAHVGYELLSVLGPSISPGAMADRSTPGRGPRQPGTPRARPRRRAQRDPATWSGRTGRGHRAHPAAGAPPASRRSPPPCAAPR